MLRGGRSIDSARTSIIRGDVRGIRQRSGQSIAPDPYPHRIGRTLKVAYRLQPKIDPGIRLPAQDLVAAGWKRLPSHEPPCRRIVTAAGGVTQDPEGGGV